MPAFRLSTFDPAQSFKFAVEWKGITQGIFTSCEGLTMEREIVTYKEGGTNDYIHQLPGRITQQRITLKRGVVYDQALWEWFRTGILDGKVERVNMTIRVGDSKFKTVQVWDVLDAWPVKYEGPSLTADSVEAALERLEIAHHGLILTSETETPFGAS